jgi:hypothetical protein
MKRREVEEEESSGGMRGTGMRNDVDSGCCSGSVCSKWKGEIDCE